MTQNKLSTWLLWRPLQFTAMFLAITLALSVIYGLFMGWVAPESDLMWPLWSLIGLTFIGCTLWLCKKLPADNLDRRSFISVFTATNVIMFIMYLATVLGALAIVQKMIFAPIFAPSIMFALGAILLIGVYSLCLGITELIATYHRVRAMGVDRRTALWNIPFGLCLLAAPAYILPDASRKRKTATNFGNGAYSRVVEWIVSTRGAAFSLMALGLIIATIVMGINNSATLGWIGLAFFSTWYVFTRNNTKRTISGAYTKTTAVLNIIAIIATIMTFAYVSAPQTVPTNTSAETIEVAL